MHSTLSVASLIRTKVVYVFVEVIKEDTQQELLLASDQTYGSNRQKDGTITITMRLQPGTIKGLKGCQEEYKFHSLDKLMQALLTVYVWYKKGKIIDAGSK